MSYLNNVKASSDEGTEDNELIIKELNDFIAGEENAEKKEEEAPAPKKENTDDAAKNGEKKYFARPGTLKDKVCVKITEVYDHQKDLLKHYNLNENEKIATNKEKEKILFSLIS